MSEAFVLRSYPFGEADLVVSFFTRDQGKLRGVAKRARRLKSNYGSGLERLSQIRASYYQKEGAELVRLDSCELIQSQFGLAGSYLASVALDFIAEVSDHLLPPSEPGERFYRLIGAVLAELRAAPESAAWRVILYFSFWAVRLSGFLPEHLRVSVESREFAALMATTPIHTLPRPEGDWPQPAYADLRRVLIREIENHSERRLVTAPLLESL